MPTFIRETFVLAADEEKEMLFAYLNKDGNIFLTDDLDENSQSYFYAILTKEDWIEMKAFIDNQFNIT